MPETTDVFEILERLEVAAQSNQLTDKQLYEARQILIDMDEIQTSNARRLTRLRLKNGRFMWVHVSELQRWAASTPPPPLAKLSSINDLLPSPMLRKRLKKMMADQAAHIDELQRAGRLKAARWNAWCTWGLWFWYVLKSPVTSLLSVAKRAIS